MQEKTHRENGNHHDSGVRVLNLPQFRYRPEIDGLRAISVIAVVLFHAGLGCSGGYVGVDVFFVISGFLITSLLLRDLSESKFSMIQFWERRIRRIVPALVAVLVPTLLVGYLLLAPGDLDDLGIATISQALMAANIYFWNETGYFAGPAELKPLLHTWSLAVEEQFYLFFPIGLCLIYRVSRKSVLLCFLLLASLSMTVNVYAVSRSPSATFFLLPTRAWELLVGSIVATIPIVRVKPWFDEFGSALGLVSIIASVFLYSPATLFPGLAASVPVLGGGLFLFCNTRFLTFPGRILAYKPIVFVGLISYSLYLWHWPILVYTRYVMNEVPRPLAVVACLVSIGIASFSYHFIEQPFRKRVYCKTRQSVFTFAAFSIGLLIAAGIFFHQQEGIPHRYPEEFTTYWDDAEYWGEQHQCTQADLTIDRLPQIGEVSQTTPQFIVWGDSHAMATTHSIESTAKAFGIWGYIAANNSTIPLPGIWPNGYDGNAKNRWNDRVFKLITENEIPHVILIARWNAYVDGCSETEIRLMPEGKVRKRILAIETFGAVPTKPKAKANVARHLKQLVEQFSKKGVTTWLVLQAPEPSRNLIAHQFATYRMFPHWNARPPRYGSDQKNFQKRQHAMKEIVSSIPSKYFHVVDASETFFDDQDRLILYDRTAFFRDLNHVTKSGVDLHFGPVFKKMFDQVTSAPKPMAKSISAEQSQK